jgi:hypothetical protein
MVKIAHTDRSAQISSQQRVTWLVATGIAASAAVLAIFLLFGLIVAALADRRRLQFLKSPAPWIMTVRS